MSEREETGEAIDAHAMTCRELVALVTEYLDGGLAKAQRDLFEAHLRQCVGCRRHLEQIRITIATLGRVRPEDLSPEARSCLLDAFRSWKQ